MSAADLIALAERCEAATGQDRELDVDICATAEPDREVYYGYFVADLRTSSPSNTNDAIAKLCKIPAYTGSLDAAMYLVSDQCDASVSREQRFGVASVETRSRFATAPDIVAKTPALALCAAALRARAASVDQEYAG